MREAGEWSGLRDERERGGGGGGGGGGEGGGVNRVMEDGFRPK